MQLAVDRLLAIDVEIQVEMDDLDDLQRAALNEARFGGGGGGGDHEEEEVLVNMYLPNSFTSSNMHSSVDSGTKADGLGGVVRGGEGGGDFSSDSGSDDDDDEDSDDDEDKVDPAKALLHIRLMADKLDAILFVFLSYIQDLVAARQIYYSNDDNNKHHHRHLHHQTPTTILDSHLEFGPLDDLFEILMGVFERTVLPTHRSRFTQYIYFYLCAQSPSYADIFMGHLVSRTFDSSVPTVLRVCAAAYLGSFIARAKYVGIQAVRACLQLLCAWAAEYVDQYDATIAAAATANGGNAVGGGGGSAAVSQRKLADALERLKQQQQAANSDGREASPPRSPPPSSRMDVTPTPPNSPALVNPSTNNSTTAITASTTNIDTKKYASFYTITQAILYIFCFRWRELIGTTGKSDHPCTYDDEEEEEDMDRAPRHLEDVSTDESNSDNTAYTNTTIIKHNNQFRIHSSSTSVAAAAAYPINLSSSSAGQLPSEMRKHFPKIVMSKLTPLRVGCMPSIVAEAARVMHKRELFYCYPFMGNEATTSIGNTDVMEDDESEREKKGTSDVSNADSRTVTSSSTAKSHVVCDFFPFEPLTLIKSGVFANGLYNVYEGGEDNDDQDEEEEGGEEVEEVEELEF